MIVQPAEEAPLTVHRSAIRATLSQHKLKTMYNTPAKPNLCPRRTRHKTHPIQNSVLTTSTRSPTQLKKLTQYKLRPYPVNLKPHPTQKT
eukprot:355341-Chlamydomonas_euryale.AAC.1